MSALNTNLQISNEWHVLKGEVQYGPYTYGEMIKMMQDKMLFGFDYVWAPHIEAWTAASELAEFSADRLTLLAQEQQEGFNRRSSPRVAVQLPVFCHDNAKLWTGVCENLSAGGALLLMENPALLPGHLVNVHYRGIKETDQAFNCTAEILSKRLTKQRIQHDTGIYYAVKFVQKTPGADSQIQSWINDGKQK